ncbi:MAG TPA: site-specific DNA-methyltransferase [Nitrososphaera sp.]|jgi:DNA modification methylase
MKEVSNREGLPRQISYDLYEGDSRKELVRLARDSSEKEKYRLIVTSPPYFGHRHYGEHAEELGQEKTDGEFIRNLADIFSAGRELLTNDGSIWIVIGDTRRNMHKLMIPHRLALELVKRDFTFREDIVWYKKNNIASSARSNFSQAYEYILFLSKHEKSFTNLDDIRVKGNEAREGRNKTPPEHRIQYKPINSDRRKIAELEEIIHGAKPNTPFDSLPSTSEISRAYGYDPEKHCPTCYRKFKRHATRKRIGDHKHYPIFAVCNPAGKNPGNVWEISTKAHYGNEHFAIFPEDLVARIISFASQEGDWVLDPFMGRGTTGIVCALTGRNFTGIDLYANNKKNADRNIANAVRGRYDKKLVEDVARQTELMRVLQDRGTLTLQDFLLTDGTLSSR